MPGIYTPLADVGSPAMMVQYQDSQKPLYLTIEEHYCCDARAAAPVNLRRNGISNAWLPEDILAREHPVRFYGLMVFYLVRYLMRLRLIRMAWSSQT